MKISPPVAMEVEMGYDPIDKEAMRVFSNDYPGLARPEVVIVIPAFNEERSLPHVKEALPVEIAGTHLLPVVVVDGATDNTEAVARSLGLAVCVARQNRGQGAALKLGYKVALSLGATYIVVVDADGQWDPSDMKSLLAPLLSNEADFVQGSRKLGRSEVGDRVRDTGVVFFASLVSLLIKKRVTDTSSGYRAFKVSLLDKIRLDEPQYQSSELLISAAYAGARLAEFPVVMSKRKSGHSKKGNNLKYGYSYLRVVFRTWYRERWLLRG